MCSICFFRRWGQEKGCLSAHAVHWHELTVTDTAGGEKQLLGECVLGSSAHLPSIHAVSKREGGSGGRWKLFPTQRFKVLRTSPCPSELAFKWLSHTGTPSLAALRHFSEKGSRWNSSGKLPDKGNLYRYLQEIRDTKYF